MVFFWGGGGSIAANGFEDLFDRNHHKRRFLKVLGPNPLKTMFSEGFIKFKRSINACYSVVSKGLSKNDFTASLLLSSGNKLFVTILQQLSANICF